MTHLRDVSASGEDEGERTDGGGHPAERDLVAGVTHRLLGLLAVPVVVRSRYMLRGGTTLYTNRPTVNIEQSRETMSVYV